VTIPSDLEEYIHDDEAAWPDSLKIQVAETRRRCRQLNAERETDFYLALSEHQAKALAEGDAAVIAEVQAMARTMLQWRTADKPAPKKRRR
jgi:hypothetical protein